MLSCRELVVRTSALVDGELGWWERLQVRLHLLVCRSCRGFVDVFSVLGTSVAATPQALEDEAAVDRITAKVLAAAGDRRETGR